jgi:hypothetical protein
MVINKTQAIEMLVRLFEENKLTFGCMKVLKASFDEAVEAVNEMREDGSSGLPYRDMEEDFYYTKEFEVEQKLKQKGLKASPALVRVISEIAIAEAEYTIEDLRFS